MTESRSEIKERRWGKCFPEGEIQLQQREMKRTRRVKMPSIALKDEDDEGRVNERREGVEGKGTKMTPTRKIRNEMEMKKKRKKRKTKMMRRWMETERKMK